MPDRHFLTTPAGFLKKIFLRLISMNRYLRKKTEQSHEMNTPVKLFCCNDSDCSDHFCDQLFELSGNTICCLLHFFVIQLLF